MKITDWTLYTPDKNFHVFLEIHTDDEVSGWGAACSQKEQVLAAFAWLKRFVVNENPLEVESLTEKLHQTARGLEHGGALTHAISAINMALWDVAGKALGQPVHVLLGGRRHESVPVYGSVGFHPVDSLAARVGQLRDRGFRAIKFGWEPFGRQTLSEDEDLVRTARQAVGDSVVLLVDAGGSEPFWKMRFKDALLRARMLADYGVYFFEEPLLPDDIDGYKRLTEVSPVKIAHGEVLSRRQSFVHYFRERAMDIAQPEVSKVGGLSEMRRIAWLAEAHGIEIIPDGRHTALGLAADMHLVSTLPTRSFVEFNLGNPLIEAIASPRFKIDSSGRIPVPDTPGLGIEIDRERLKYFESENFASRSWTWDEEKRFESAG